jgi:hypothetical protein
MKASWSGLDPDPNCFLHSAAASAMVDSSAHGVSYDQRLCLVLPTQNIEFQHSDSSFVNVGAIE